MAEDAADLAGLIGELGYDAPVALLPEQIVRQLALGLPVLVAEEGGELIGCITGSVMEVIHRPTPVGRVSMLVVTEAARGRGVGGALVAAMEARLRERGCALVEVTSNYRLTPAHAFYERLGYERTSHRFARRLS